jgi:serine/threonine-protein kinase
VNEVPPVPLFAPQRWSELRALLERLRELSPEAQARELDHLAETDAGLAAAARAMRESAAVPLEAAVDRLLAAKDAAPPATLGPFRLLERIGVGGMGEVYLAERHGDDFIQRVALKLLDRDAGRTARFAARERRILAALSHPNITAFVDAGNDQGRGWLAMEYVGGEPLLAYCRRHDLDLPARVHLFDQVCAAVAHAHAQLVVHRDLKPSNVLVTTDGTVKLLDFGIALALDADDGEAVPTRVFTPEYAAPEQLRGERAGTATDVYALGLMLYELAAGRRLPTLQARADADWTTTELVRFATVASPSGTAVSYIDPKAVLRALHGDLGRIVAHALAFDPVRRYASVALLRDDLQRWLDHRPLGIARPGLAYTAARFVRRNRAAVAVAVVALFALFAALGFALWQARQATRMAAQSEHAETFLADLFTDADPFNSARSDTNKVELLRNAALRIDKDLPDAPQQQIKLRQILATALTRMGEPALARELQRKNVDQSRALYGERAPQLGAALGTLAIGTEEGGDVDAARKLFVQSYALLEHAGDRWRADRISALTGLAKMANRADDHAEAERIHRQVLAEREAMEGAESRDVAMDLMNLCADALYQEHYAEAVRFGERARAMIERTLGPRHARTLYVDDALGLAQAGVAGKTAAAEARLDAAVRLARATLPPQASIRATLLAALGNAHFVAGHDAAAIAAANEALPLFAAGKMPGIGAVELTLGRAQLRAQSTQATATLRQARADLAAAGGRVAGSAKLAALADAAYGASLAHDGDTAAGERLARAARVELLAGPYAGSVALADIDAYLADVLDARGGHDEARKLRDEALSAYRRVYGPGHPGEQTLLTEMSAGR